MTAMASAAVTTTLSLGEWRVSNDPGEVLLCLGLGSCIAFVAWDAAARVAGMAHMVLPDSTQGRPSALTPAKFVDLAVPLVTGAMLDRGARRDRMRVHLVGGARMLQGVQHQSAMNIGERNAEAARKAVAAAGLRVHIENTGGGHGRTVRMAVADGSVLVTSPGAQQAAA